MDTPRYSAVACQAVCVAFSVLSWFMISVRFYTRIMISTNLGMDDWAMLFTTVCFTGFAVSTYNTVWLVLYGDMASIDGLSLVTQWLFATYNLFIACTLVLKVALTLFFLRLFPQKTHKTQRKVIMGCAAVFLCLGTALFFVNLFDCGDPLDYFQNYVQGNCITKGPIGLTFGYVYAALNAVTDWICVALPIFVIRKMQLNGRNRRGAIVLVGFGVAASICSVVRIGYIHLLAGNLDEIYRSAETTATLAIIEIALGIIATSAATLRPLFKKLNISGFESRIRSRVSRKRHPSGATNSSAGESTGTATTMTTTTTTTMDDKEMEYQLEHTHGRDPAYEEKEAGMTPDANGTHSIAVGHLYRVDSRDAMRDEMHELEPPKKYRRWSHAPRISMSWLQGYNSDPDEKVLVAKLPTHTNER